MNQRAWQRAYGNTPEQFHRRLCATLDGLEERDVKRRKRYKASMALVAALAAILLAGAGFAANRMGIFDMLTNSAIPIVPLEGAEELVVTGLGAAENELVELRVEEAVFDGRSVMVQTRLTPKDAEHYALFNAFIQNTPEDVYIVEKEQVGQQQWEFNVTGRRDGKQLVYYWVTESGLDHAAAWDETVDVEEQDDGSILWRMSAILDAESDAEALELNVRAQISIDGEDMPLDEVAVTIPHEGTVRHARLTPVGEDLERFGVISGELTFSKVRAYLNVEYTYQQAEAGEEMGIAIRVYDGQGDPVPTGGGSGVDPNAKGVYSTQLEMQSFDQLPERLWLEAKVIGEDVTLGRIDCELTEE